MAVVLDPDPRLPNYDLIKPLKDEIQDLRDEVEVHTQSLLEWVGRIEAALDGVEYEVVEDDLPSA